MHRKETKQHKWTLNNFNPYKTLGVGDQKVIATYVPTANIKKIIIIKEISLGWHEKKAIGGLCQRFNIESNKQWQQQSLGETCPQTSTTALCKGQVGRQDIDTWTCWSPPSKQFLQLVMTGLEAVIGVNMFSTGHTCVCLCVYLWQNRDYYPPAMPVLLSKWILDFMSLIGVVLSLWQRLKEAGLLFQFLYVNWF